MKKTFIATFLTLILCCLYSADNQVLYAKSKHSKLSEYNLHLSKDSLKNELNKVIKEPYDVEINDTSIIINFHKTVLTNDQYLKNKLFSITSFLESKKIHPAVVIAAWKNLDSNYEYKAAVTSDDLSDYNKGMINYDTLFDRMKIVKSEIVRSRDTLDDNLKDTARLHITPTNTVLRPDKEITLRPTIPPESFYTPILKPIIHDDFYVLAEENDVTINIFKYPPEENSALKDMAYNIMRRIMGVNPSLNKIVINWQQEEGGYGKSASLAGIYIKDFFKKRITRNEIKEVILISSIEPTSRHLNEVPGVAKVDVPIDNLRKGKELRQAANIYRQNNQYDSAIRTYKNAISFNPNDFLSYYWLGEIYIQLKDFELAREYLQQSLGLNPEFRQADETLAKIKSK